VAAGVGSGFAGKIHPYTTGVARRLPKVPHTPAEAARTVFQQEKSAIRVLIVDDHQLFADAMSALLADHGIEVVGIATTARDAIAAVAEHSPDVVLLDLGLPDAEGVGAGEQIIRERPAVKVVALSAMKDPSVVRAAIAAGFHGYLTKDIPVAQLVTSLQAAIEGQLVVPHRLAAQARMGKQDSDLLIAQLTRREREVLALLTEGESTEDIALRLSVSPHTVRTHVQRILAKLGLHSRLEAAAFAMRHNVVHSVERRYA
jgi:two-component system, NarL family, nitrate/nitrite response regulator NarL